MLLCGKVRPISLNRLTKPLKFFPQNEKSCAEARRDMADGGKSGLSSGGEGRSAKVWVRKVGEDGAADKSEG